MQASRHLPPLSMVSRMARDRARRETKHVDLVVRRDREDRVLGLIEDETASSSGGIGGGADLVPENVSCLRVAVSLMMRA